MKIKICGIFRTEDIDSINKYKPDYIGFVFANSRRRITQNLAKEIRRKLDPQIIVVGVFVNETNERIRQLYGEHIIDIAQFHGQESEDQIHELHDQIGIPIIRSVTIRCANDLLQKQSTEAEYLLLDYGQGGTGKSFDWKILEQITDFPQAFPPCFWAGGFHEGNIDNVLQYKPFAIDISSGVETDGVKDAAKIARCIKMVHRMEIPQTY